MKFFWWLLIFILLSLNVSSYWQTYQSDLKNSGFSNGTGYFPLKTANFSDNSSGMNFQPLVDDIDRDGKNEIVIFSNNSLVIFNPQLTILNQIKVGAILGQPTLFDFDNDNLVEIIFNARQNSTDYFFAYQYNNQNLDQKFNITLSNDANLGGIKCANIGGVNSCVFKDKRNYVHVVDMNSRIDSSYNISAYNETRQTVPAIGDIDNDGNLDAVFWFNPNGDGGYGFLVFDLNNRVVKWTVDDIFFPLFGNPLPPVLKGNPVLVDLKNDGKLEIAASVFYHDDCRVDRCDDYWTELFVYNSSGGKLFSKCEKSPGGDCYDGVSAHVWEGTNPFVMDSNDDGVDDICFIKDKKFFYVFKEMAISCYNYSGSLMYEAELSHPASTATVRAAITADINNDGVKEIITEGNIFLKNGTSIFILNLGSNFAVPVDIDGNKGLDLVWTKNLQTRVFLDSNNYTSDFSVSESGISFSKSDQTHVKVSAVIKNVGQVGADNVKVIIYNTGTLENKTAILNIRRNGNATFSAVLGLKEGEKVLVSADPDNDINETDETNNFAFKEFNGFPYVFVSSDLEPFNIDSEFKNYIKNKLASGYYTENENEADVLVYIGKNNPRNQDNNIKTLNDFEFGYDYGNIIYNDKTGSLPYNGLVGAFKDSNGKTIIMIVGNEIEGNIAAAKEFIKSQSLFLNVQDKNSIFIDDENADAVKVYDFLHLGGNNEHYNANDDEFKLIVRNALNDNMFNVEDKNVVTSNGITLRLRNMKPNISNDYLEYLNSTGMPVEMPVVLAHGIFSNLTTWEGLGSEISNTGRDTWLVEITGGPSQDCDDCIDYTFYNLTDIFVPALLNGVLTFTGKDKIQYVGFSNGCRAALDTLERGQFDSNKVETFVAVGCPGSFNHSESVSSASPISKVLNKDGDSAINSFKNKNLKHISFSDLAKEIIDIERFFDDKTKISVNLFQQYYNWSVDTFDQEPGENVVINNFFAIQGNLFSNSDGVVSTYDINKTYNNINANKKKYINIPASHLGLDDATRTKVFIRKILNNETFTTIENLIFVIKSEP